MSRLSFSPDTWKDTDGGEEVRGGFVMRGQTTKRMDSYVHERGQNPGSRLNRFREPAYLPDHWLHAAVRVAPATLWALNVEGPPDFVRFHATRSVRTGQRSLFMAHSMLRAGRPS